MSRIPSIDNLIPALYLKENSTQDFPRAVAAILGENAKRMSASTVVLTGIPAAGAPLFVCFVIGLWFLW